MARKRLLALVSIALLLSCAALLAFHIRIPAVKSLTYDTPVVYVPPETYRPPAGEGRINVNTATVEELTELNGIGEATARKLIAEREANGPFYFPEDLLAVNGIGEKTLNKIRDQICFE